MHTFSQVWAQLEHFEFQNLKLQIMSQYLWINTISFTDNLSAFSRITIAVRLFIVAVEEIYTSRLSQSRTEVSWLAANIRELALHSKLLCLIHFPDSSRQTYDTTWRQATRLQYTQYSNHAWGFPKAIRPIRSYSSDFYRALSKWKLPNWFWIDLRIDSKLSWAKEKFISNYLKWNDIEMPNKLNQNGV